MKKQVEVKELIRVYTILQQNEDNTVDLCGCYTDYKVALKVCKKLNKIYTQEYYINDCLLNYDYQKRIGYIK
jgi:hypothetical protein